MRTVVKISLEIEVDVDELGRIDEDSLKEKVYSMLSESLDDESLEYDFNVDEDETDGY